MSNTLFMAFAKGQESKEASEIKRYIGFAPVKILAVNPNKAQIKELMGYEPTEEPVYTGTQEVDGAKVPYARIDFIVRTVAEQANGIEITNRLTFFLRNQYRKGSQSGKYQVIDEFGRTAWANEDVIKAKAKIMYKDGTMEANVTQNYRPAYVGEEELTVFIKRYLNIPEVMEYVNGTWVMKANTDDSLCRLDEITKYFKGDFSEIKDAIALQPNNKVKVLFGVRTTDDGKEYQDLYTTVLRNNSNNYTAIQKEIEERKANGGLSNRYYEFCELKEYEVTPTNVSEKKADDPFASADVETPW